MSDSSKLFTPRIIQSFSYKKSQKTKFILSFFALALTTALFIWPSLKKYQLDQRSLASVEQLPVGSSNMASYPSFRDTDKKNQPYVITADTSTDISPEELDLKHPKFVLTLNGGGKVTLEATAGVLKKVEKVLHLVGNVRLSHSDGYEVQTAQAWIQCGEGTAHGNDSIWGDGPAGKIDAKGFRLTENGRKISFIGRVQLLLNGK